MLRPANESVTSSPATGVTSSARKNRPITLPLGASVRLTVSCSPSVPIAPTAAAPSAPRQAWLPAHRRGGGRVQRESKASEGGPYALPEARREGPVRLSALNQRRRKIG